MEHEQKRILVVDDDRTFRVRLGKALDRRGFDVLLAQDVTSARQLIDSNPFPGYAVLDLRMPGESGMTLIQELSRMSSTIRVVVLTAYGSIANAMEAVRLGAADYLTKPADADQITAALLGEKPEAALAEVEQPITLEQAEWEHIHRILLEHDGNISATARVLGIHRRSLQRKLSKWSPWKA